ncbi:hypothetical protein [Wukongibacter sp. M2B1]|uniref:hypothetical protein n=1 Tax=Wukongibacter sp. M2B1 TaxID=3088895 RepID=UPI003D7A47DA
MSTLTGWSRQCIETYQSDIKELEKQNRDFSQKILDNLDEIEMKKRYIDDILITEKEAI